jgi:hypothetical protein
LSRRRNPPFICAKKAGYAFGYNPPYGLLIHEIPESNESIEPKKFSPGNKDRHGVIEYVKGFES